MFSAWDGDNRGKFLERIKPIVGELLDTERNVLVMKGGTKEESGTLQSILMGMGLYNEEFHNNYMSRSRELMMHLDPSGMLQTNREAENQGATEEGPERDAIFEAYHKGQPDVNIPALNVRDGVLWRDSKGLGRFRPKNGDFLIGRGDMAEVVSLLRKVAVDQGGGQWTAKQSQSARDWLVDHNNNKFPLVAFDMISQVHDLTVDGSLDSMDADVMLRSWNNFVDVLPEGDPMSGAFPDSPYDVFASTLKQYQRYVSNQEEPYLPGDDIEGLSPKQRLTVNVMEWLSRGAPDFVAGRPMQHSWDLSEYLPMGETNGLTPESFFRATGISVNPESGKYGFRFKISADTPEFLIHLRDRGLEPRTLVDFNAEYSLFKEFADTTVERPFRRDEVRSTAEYLRDTIGIDTRNVGRVLEIDPQLTGPAEPGVPDEFRLRPYSIEEMKPMVNKVLSYEVGRTLDSIGRGGPDASGWPAPLTPEQVIPGFLDRTHRVMTDQGWVTKKQKGGQWTPEEYREHLKPVWDFPQEFVDNPAENLIGLHESVTQRMYELDMERDRYADLRAEGKMSAVVYDRAIMRAQDIQDKLGAMSDMLANHGAYLESVGEADVYSRMWERRSATVDARLRREGN